MSSEQQVTVEHRRIGKIALDASEVLHFSGLPGFPAVRDFALAQHGDGSPFAWLASLDDLDLAFVVAEPEKLFTEYRPAFGPRELGAVGAAETGEVLVLAIANLTRGEACLNLAAPILVNAKTRRAAQVVLPDSKFAVRAKLGSVSAR